MSRTLINVFDNFGVESLLGNALGFINVDEKGLYNDIIELIPKEKFIIEILETTIVTEKLLNRIIELKNKGYRFALDDVIFTEEYLQMFSPLMGLVDFIKVDIREVGQSTLREEIPLLKKYPAKLIAEKVEYRLEYELCNEIGFDYFQGYYFAQTDILEKKSIDPSQLGVLKIIKMINNKADIDNISDVFSINPDLSYNLLKFINSAVFFFRSSIKSIKHAITLVGLKRLQNWLFLLSYAKSGNSSQISVLLQTAVVRAKTMEHLIEMSKENILADSAFLVGMLSLIDTLFSTSKEELINDLNVDEEIRVALLEYGGRLGTLLRAVISAEDGNFDEVKVDLEECNMTLENFSEAQIQSYIWYEKLIHEIG